MDPDELKKRRLFKGLTQKEVADLIGVSFQTYNGYENGKKIPSTKYQILDTVLSIMPENVNEPKEEYNKLSGYDKTIKHLNDLIIQRKEILKLLDPKSLEYSQNLELIKLYEERIHYTKIAKENHNK